MENVSGRISRSSLLLPKLPETAFHWNILRLKASMDAFSDEQNIEVYRFLGKKILFSRCLTNSSEYLIVQYPIWEILDVAIVKSNNADSNWDERILANTYRVHMLVGIRSLDEIRQSTFIARASLIGRVDRIGIKWVWENEFLRCTKISVDEI